MPLARFSLAVLLNITTSNFHASTCSREDFELFARDLNACHGDRFGPECKQRLTKDMSYMPASQSIDYPSDLLTMHTTSRSHLNDCASLWLQNWVCSLVPGPRDLSGITVGKTILQRVMHLFSSTLDMRHSPHRPTFDRAKLRSWRWRPEEHANGQACSSDEAWLLSDLCAPGGGGGFRGFGQSAIAEVGRLPTSVIKDGASILRSAVLATSSSSSLSGGGENAGDFSKAFSMASLWWTGQLTLHSLSSIGACGTAAVAKLPISRSWQTPGRRDIAIAMHIRRGDSCMRWTSEEGDASLRTGRPCFKTELYVRAARRMQHAYGATTVLLATDSEDAASEVLASLSAPIKVDDANDILPAMNVVQVLYDRRSVGGSSRVNNGKRVDQGTIYIEDRLKRKDPDLDTELVFSSLFAELKLLSSAHMLIGTSGSWVTRLVFFMITGRRGGRPPPFTFMDAPFGCLNIKPCAVM